MFTILLWAPHPCFLLYQRTPSTFPTLSGHPIHVSHFIRAPHPCSPFYQGHPIHISHFIRAPHLCPPLYQHTPSTVFPTLSGTPNPTCCPLYQGHPIHCVHHVVKAPHLCSLLYQGHPIHCVHRFM